MILPETNAYVKSYDEQIKWMYFWLKVNTKYDLEKYNII